MEQLSLLKRQQSEALKLLSDWSKWVVALETTAVAAVAAILKDGVLPRTHEHPYLFVPLAAALTLAATSFLFSIWNAGLLLYSIPDVVQALATSTEADYNHMASPHFKTKLVVYENRQQRGLAWGLVLFAVGMLVWLVASVVLSLAIPAVKT
jgi:hypothetical protein